MFIMLQEIVDQKQVMLQRSPEGILGVVIQVSWTETVLADHSAYTLYSHCMKYAVAFSMRIYNASEGRVTCSISFYRVGLTGNLQLK